MACSWVVLGVPPFSDDGNVLRLIVTNGGNHFNNVLKIFCTSGIQ